MISFLTARNFHALLAPGFSPFAAALFLGVVALGMGSVCPSNLLASTLYVDNQGGDDRNTGIQNTAREGRNGPLHSISRALQLAQPAGRIVIRNTGVPYRECLTLQGGNNSGAFGQPFRIIGNGAILSGAKPVPDQAWKHVAGNVFAFRPERLSYQQIYANGLPLQFVPATGKAPPALKPLQWTLFEQQILLEVEPGRPPSAYAMEYAADRVGITLYDVHDVAIENLVVEAFQLDGINAHDLVRHCELQGVTSRGNGRSGISVGGASRVRILNSLVGDNGEAQVRTEGFCRVVLQNNELLENPAPKIDRVGGTVVEE